MGKQPYISAVVTSRNDDHGGNLRERMQIFVDAWFTQVRRHGLDAELIVVEWNPPPDKPSLAEALRWPDDGGSGEARIIEVPPSVHAAYAHAAQLPLYQFIAKNVGIRRARGRFVLATNIDIILSSELCEFLARRQLDAKKVYRNDRYDVADSIVTEKGVTDYESYCNSHLIRVNGPAWTIDLRDGRIHQVFLSKRFKAMTRAFSTLGHFVSALPRLGRLVRGLTAIRRGAPPLGPELARRALSSLMRNGAPPSGLDRKPIPAHVNACGDFTLMAREVWEELRGHPEYDGYSMHLDSVVLLAAIAAGLVEEEVLPYPMRHFHIDHSAGSGYTPEAEAKLYSRLAAKGIPYLSWDDVERLIETFWLMPDKVRYNDHNWGLAQSNFRETIVAASPGALAEAL